jgi:HipA-like kinase
MLETRTMPALDPVLATRYVTALREGGSLPGLVEGDDDGLYVAKFRGAGQGLRALVAEVLVGELIRRAGLLVPRLVRIEIDARLGAAEPDPEIQELLAASAGENLGVDFLPGSLPYTAAGAWQPEPDLAAEVVWLDALTTNVDRTARNPNLLLWHDRLWLIDHGAALYLQHGGLSVEVAQRPFPLIADHVLLRHASSIVDAGARLRGRFDLTEAIAESLALVPGDWFEGGDPSPLYAEYLSTRSDWAGFEEEGERARRELA